MQYNFKKTLLDTWISCLNDHRKECWDFMLWKTTILSYWKFEIFIDQSSLEAGSTLLT